MRANNIHKNKIVELKYLTPDAIDSYLSQCGNRVSCVVGFGNSSPTAKISGFPVLWVETQVFGSEAIYEVWTSDKPVTQYQDEYISGAGNKEIFFGRMSVQFVSGEDFSEITKRVYSRIFEFLRHSIYPNLLKVWNYFPGINTIEAGIERYQSFSIGRHEAFVRYNKTIDDSPSACALGSRGETLNIYFLASRSPGVQIENPRQTSAYNYPKQYGPRSPLFSRATLAFHGESRTLFISGTASILGHITVHPESVILQTHETLANIRAVIDQANQEGFNFAGFETGMALKIYVRHAEHLSAVQDVIREELGVLHEMVIMQGDICRKDLLMEAEAICWGCTGSENAMRRQLI